LLSVRFVALIWRTIRAQVIGNLSLIAAVVTISILHNWSSQVDEFSLLLFVPKWMWGTLLIATVVIAGLDVVFWVTWSRRSLREGVKT